MLQDFHFKHVFIGRHLPVTALIVLDWFGTHWLSQLQLSRIASSLHCCLLATNMVLFKCKCSLSHPFRAMKRANDGEEPPWREQRKRAKIPQPLTNPIGKASTVAVAKESWQHKYMSTSVTFHSWFKQIVIHTIYALFFHGLYSKPTFEYTG